MSLNDVEIDDSDSVRNKLLNDKYNKEAEERKMKNKLIREQYPKFLYYKCKKCEEYKHYTNYKPMFKDSNDEVNYIYNKIDGFLLDKDDNKVYYVKSDLCNDCYNIQKERVVKFQQYYKTILQDCKKQCPCGLSFFKGFSNTEDIGECYLKKHYGSKRHQNYIELIENQKTDNELHLNSLSKKQLVDICKNNKIYGMTNSKKADIILEILKYNIKI